MPSFYKGQEIKFKLDITAEGFDMNEMDFDVEVTSSNRTVKGEKKGASSEGKWGSADVAITRDTVESERTAEDESGEETTDTTTTNEWYVVLDTSNLPTGTMIVKVTAYVTDAMAYDGVRTDIAKAELGRLID